MVKRLLIIRIIFFSVLFSPFAVMGQTYKKLVDETFENGTSDPSNNPEGKIAPGYTDYTPRYVRGDVDTGQLKDGNYAVVKNSGNYDYFGVTYKNAWQHGWDHTTGSSYMMLINANSKKIGESAGSYYIYATSAFDIPGAQYIVSFWGANLMRFNYKTSDIGPWGNTDPPTFKNAYIGLAVRNNQTGSGSIYAQQNWILPKAGTTGAPTVDDGNGLPWVKRELTFTLPTTYSSGTPLYFNFFNSDLNGTAPNADYGNDLAIDDILIEMRVVALTGNIYNDANKNGTKDQGESAVSTSGSSPLYVYLTKADGSIISKAQVQSDGTYTLSGDNGVPFVDNNIGMKIIVSPADLPVDTGNINDATAPNGYSFVSETAPTNVSSGSADGAMTITNSSGDIDGVNFGVNENPVSYPITNEVGGAPALTNLGNKPLEGSDATDQSERGPWTGKTITITTLPNNGFILKYNGETITAGQTFANYDPNALSIEPGPETAGGTQTTTFQYTVTDNAGLVSEPSPYTVNFSQPLPVMFGLVNSSISGNTLTVNWETITETNAAYFIIEGSNDGNTFYELGRKDAIGDATTISKYEFSKNLSETSILGFPLIVFCLLLLMLAVRRKNKWMLTSVITGIVLCSTVFYSCSKRDISSSDLNNKKIFIRVVEVDKDGAKHYSKPVLAANENDK